MKAGSMEAQMTVRWLASAVHEAAAPSAAFRSCVDEMSSLKSLSGMSTNRPCIQIH